MIMYENGITVEILRWHLKQRKNREIIIYYEFETPDDDDFDTDTDIHTVTGIADDGGAIRILSEPDNGKRMKTNELIKRLSGLNKDTPVSLVKNELITGVCLGTDDDGIFCFALENNVMY